MKIIEFNDDGVEIEDYKKLSVLFSPSLYGEFLCYNHWIWLEEKDMWGNQIGWWLLGVGLEYPPWNINDNIKGDFKRDADYKKFDEIKKKHKGDYN